MYTKYENIGDSRRYFDDQSEPNEVTNALAFGYGLAWKGLENYWSI